MKGKQTKTKRCLECGYLFATQGLARHMVAAHRKRPKLHKNYEEITPTDITPKEKPRRKQTIVMPNAQYIDVPAIIRIPVQMGPIQILSIEEETKK